MMKYIDTLEEELDNTQAAALLAERQHMDNWTEGNDLAGKAEDNLLKRSDFLRGLADEKNND
ncbi:hypothetical protein ACFSUO_08215 [Lentibacillus juripiscarius]|uniref:Uncharacterized protein n=2 Tax=Lentibacillus juripiscarius TaxID=257446 RepID=A0ABW5V5I2_9BACI